MAEAALIDRLDAVLSRAPLSRAAGRVTSVLATSIEADGPLLPLGAVCEIDAGDGAALEAEVVRTQAGRVTLMPFGPPLGGVVPGALVRAGSERADVGVVLRRRGARSTEEAARSMAGRRCTAPSAGRWPARSGRCSIAHRPPADRDRRARDRACSHWAWASAWASSPPAASARPADAQMPAGEADACVICLVGERGREARRCGAAARERPAPA